MSVIIPTYQRRRGVLAAIDSALAQTVRAAEVLVADDGSTDGTADAITSTYGDAVRFVRQANRGPSVARNRAVALATGVAVAFLDSDDRWRRHHVALLAELLRRHPEAVLVGTTRHYRFGRETPERSDALDYAEKLILGRPGVGYLSSVAVRREAIVAVGSFDERLRYGEDIDLFLRLAVLGPFALISADTLERDPSPDSLQVEGQRSGGYHGFLEHSGDSLLSALETCVRPDAERLRAAARARQAMGRALRELLGSGEPCRVRPYLEEALRLAPTLGESVDWIAGFLFLVPDCDSPTDRAGLLAALAGAWPAPGSPVVARLRLHALVAAVRKRRWASAARLARVLGTRTGARAAVRATAEKMNDANKVLRFPRGSTHSSARG
jgi:Glycosyl transferase family 2